MRKWLTVLALLAWIPSCGNPTWGQTPSVGKAHPQAAPKRAKSATGQSSPDQIGTPSRPLVVDTEGHVKTEEETAAAQKEADRASDIAGRTLGAAEGSARYAYSTAWATWLLVIVGGVGAFFANKTLKAIEAQVKLMERQGIAAQRAIIVPSPVFDDFGIAGKQFAVSVKIRNVGNDPAIKFRSWLAMRVYEGPNFPDPDSLPSQDFKANVVVFPKTDADFRIGVAWPHVQTDEFINLVQTGAWRIYCWGRFEYDSMDSVKDRFVNFCYYTICDPHVMFTSAEARNDCN